MYWSNTIQEKDILKGKNTIAYALTGLFIRCTVISSLQSTLTLPWKQTCVLLSVTDSGQCFICLLICCLDSLSKNWPIKHFYSFYSFDNLLAPSSCLASFFWQTAPLIAILQVHLWLYPVRSYLNPFSMQQAHYCRICCLKNSVISTDAFHFNSTLQTSISKWLFL